MNTTILSATLTVKALGDEPSVLITTPARDLMSDTIDPMGMDVTRYLGGPKAVNFAHDHSRLPVAQTVSLTKSVRGIVARFRWLDDVNPAAAAVRGVFERTALGASVEFIAKDSTPNRAGGLHFAKSILTGWALTANPANPECIALMKSLGLDRDEPVLVLIDDADAERFAIDPAMVGAACATALRRHVADEVRHQAVRAGLGGLAASPAILLEDADGATRTVDADTLRAAVAEALAGVSAARFARRSTPCAAGWISDGRAGHRDDARPAGQSRARGRPSRACPTPAGAAVRGGVCPTAARAGRGAPRAPGAARDIDDPLTAPGGCPMSPTDPSPLMLDDPHLAVATENLNAAKAAEAEALRQHAELPDIPKGSADVDLDRLEDRRRLKRVRTAVAQAENIYFAARGMAKTRWVHSRQPGRLERLRAVLAATEAAQAAVRALQAYDEESATALGVMPPEIPMAQLLGLNIAVERLRR
jgi:hypothetical protein